MPPFMAAKSLVSASALTFVLATRGVGAIAFQNEDAPAADFHLHHHFVKRKLKDYVAPTRQLRDGNEKVKVTFDEDKPASGESVYDILRPAGDQAHDTCPGSPFLWKIVEDSTSKHVGFALGTMHLPPEVVVTEQALTSIQNAIQDSCDVYGELNLVADEVKEEVQDCVAQENPNTPPSATVNDIPDEALRETIKAKVLEVSRALMPERANDISAHLLSLPLKTVLNMIMYYNTVEYRDIYLEEIRTGESAMLDTHVLKKGRPSGSLEKVSTQCKIIAEENVLTAEVLDANWDAYAAEIKQMLHASLSSAIQIYKCGRPETFRSAFSGGCTGSCQSRNVQMATEMNDILKANPNERVFFAVGAAHWRLEPYSMEEVLKVYGYTLVRLHSWGNADAPDYSNEQCGVVFDPEKGYYVPDDSAATETSSSVTWMHPNVRSASSSEAASRVEAQGPLVDDPSSSGIMRDSYMLFTSLLIIVGIGRF